MPGGRSSARRWLSLVAAISFVPVLGLFTTSRIFFVRDLSFFFWSRHLWLRHTIFSGQWPWWDPYVAGGQSAIADALNQLMMPVTVAVRLLPSAIVSFNLWVALPLPIAACGTFVFLRRRGAAASAAALGACAFALSGPIVSMLNLPNLSWSVALMPWVMAAVSTESPAVLAIAFGLQALCGEPVTWVATGALAIGYACVSPRPARSTFARTVFGVLLGLCGGALFAAAQLVPTFAAGVRAHRAALATPDFWSLHPMSLWETLAPHLFGNYYDAFLADLPWMGPLNFGRDPFFYSLYVSPLVLLLAIPGIVRGRRSGFWVAVIVAATIGALGGYTPLYPMLRQLVPALMYFRFPVKYLVFAVFALAVVASDGWAAILPPEGKSYGGASRLPAAAVGFGTVALALSLYAFTDSTFAGRVAHAAAASTRLKDVAAGAAFLARVGPPLAMRASALFVAGGLLLYLAIRRPAGRSLLFLAVCADLLMTSADLNQTMEVAKLTPPSWFTSAAGEERLYIGGRARGYMNGSDPDGVKTWQIPAESTAIAGRMELNAMLPMAPSGWRVREALSYDLPYLWPAQYEATLRRFEDAERGERDAFLRRSGIRRCVLPAAQQRPWPPIADVPDWNMRVYDCNPPATRVFIADAVEVAPHGASEAWEREALFDESRSDTSVRLAADPPLSGRAGPPQSPSVRIVDDRSTVVSIEASLPRAGIVVLRDTYDPEWIAEVDGNAATMVRANGLYRAVAVSPGRHVIAFHYRPREFIEGLTLSVAALLLIGFRGFRFLTFPRFSRLNPRNDRNQNLGNDRNLRNPWNPSGFTLLELMIVLAILATLLAVAFTEYRGMQAKGNEASALASIRSISVAEWQYALTCGNTKYAATLEALGQPVPQTGHAFLSPDLARPNGFEKSGYTFQLAAKPIDGAPPGCNGAPVAEKYAATADPVRPGTTGKFFYGVNADRIVFIDEEKTFTGEMPESGNPGHGTEVK